MDADNLIQWLDTQENAIESLIDELDEVQIQFNAQFDEFKAQHDSTLDYLAGQVVGRMDTLDATLHAYIQEQLVQERENIAERRRKVREEYLPLRQQAADELLSKAQAELRELRALNPELDEREETLKRGKAKLEAQLEELNEEIRQKSRGLGVAMHFVAITKADRE